MITNTLKTAKLTPLADAAASLVITKADGSTSVCSFNTSTSVATLAAVPSLPSQTAKYVLAAPNAADGVPSFRALVASDIPSLSYLALDGSNMASAAQNGDMLYYSAADGKWTRVPCPSVPVGGNEVVLKHSGINPSFVEQRYRADVDHNHSGTYEPAFTNLAFSKLPNSGTRTWAAGGDMSITGGNVGIGCTPTESLSVNGALSLQHGNAQAIMHRGVVGGSYGISIQGNTNTTLNDTYPGASVSIGGGSLSDGYEGNLILTAYGGSTSDANRNYIDFRRRTGTNTTASSMLITGGGNVGIGCTPSTKFEIGDSTAFLYSQTNNVLSTGAAYHIYKVDSIQTIVGTDRSDGGGLLNGTSANASVLGSQGNYPLQFGTNNNVRMTISTSGNVGIGCTPAAKFNVDFGGTSNYMLLSNGYGGNKAYIGSDATDCLAFYSKSSTDTVKGYKFFGGDNTLWFWLNTDNNAWLNGNLEFASYSTHSALKYKEDVRDLVDKTDELLNVRPVSYTIKESKEKHIGFIAEELDSIGLKELVRYKDGEPDSIYYDKMICFVLQLLKKHDKRIKALEER